MSGTANVGTLEGLLKLRDEFTSVLNNSIAKMGEAGVKAQAIGAKVSDMGAGLTKLALPLAAVGGLAVTSFTSFDDAMTSSLAIMGDVEVSMRDRMGQAAIDVSENLVTARMTSTDAAESYFFLASAGLDAEQSLMALGPVSLFAAAGHFDMATATDLATDAQSALGLSVGTNEERLASLTRVTDVLVGANTMANATVEQFATSLTTKAGTAMKELDIEIEEGVAVLAAWADQGVKGTLAGERFAMVTRDLKKAARENKDVFREYGIEVFDVTGKFNPLVDIIRQMENALGPMSHEQRDSTLAMLGFTSKSIQATSSLIGLSDQVESYTERLFNAGGMTELVANKQVSFSNILLVAKNRVVNTAAALGQSMVPALTLALDMFNSVIDVVEALVGWFGNLSAPIQIFAVALGGIVTAAGPVLFVVGQLISSWGVFAAALPSVAASITGVVSTILGPVGLAIAAGALLLSWEPVRTFLWDLATTVFEAVKTGISIVIDKLSEWWDAIEPVRNIIAALASVIIDDLRQSLISIGSYLADFVMRVVESHVAMFDAGVAALGLRDAGELLDVVLDTLAGALDTTVSWLMVWLEVTAFLNPAMEDFTNKLQQQIDRIRGVADGTIVAVEATEQFSTATVLAGLSLVAMDVAGAAVVAKFIALKEKATGAGEGVNYLGDSVVTVSAKVLDLKSKIGELNTAIFGATITIEGLELGLDILERTTDDTAETITDLTDDIATADHSSAAFAEGLAFVKDKSNAAGDALTGLAAVVDNLSGKLNTAMGFLGSIGGALDGLFGAGTSSTIQQWGGIADQALGVFQSFAQGNWLGVISGGINVVKGAFDSLFPSTMLVEERIATYFQHFANGEGTIEHFTNLTYDLAKSLRKVAEDGWDAARAGAMMEKNFGEFVDVALTMGDEGLAAIEEVVAAAELAGVGLEVIAQELSDAYTQAFDIMEERSQFLIDQSTILVESLNTLIGDSFNATASEVEFASTAILGAFAAMAESGMSVVDIAAQLADTFNLINDRGQQLGLELGEEFAELGTLIDVLSNETLARPIERFEAMADAVEALGNMGLLTADQFAALSNRILNMDTVLQEAGLSGTQSLASMAPQLQILFDMSQQYGFSIGEGTQALIDQALEMGLVTDQALTMEDIMINAFNALLEGVNALIVALGGIPIAFDNWNASGETMTENFDSNITVMEDGVGRFGSTVQGTWDGILVHTDDVNAAIENSAVGSSDIVASAWVGTSDLIGGALDNLGLYSDVIFTDISDVAGGHADDTYGHWRDRIEDIRRDYLDRLGDLPPPPGGGSGSGGSGPDVPGFARGSGGFVDFQESGTNVILHNREEIVTESHGESLAGMVGNAIRQANDNDNSGPGGNRVAGLLALILAAQEENNAIADQSKGSLKKLNTNMSNRRARNRTGS